LLLGAVAAYGVVCVVMAEPMKAGAIGGLYLLLAAWVPLSDSISYRPTTYGGIVVASCVIGLSCLLPGYFWLGRDIRTYLSRSNMNIFKRGGGEADPL